MASSRYSTAPSFTTMHGPQRRTVDCYFNLFERPRPLRCCNPDRPSTASSEATERNWPTRQSSLPHDVLPYFTRHRPLTPTAFLYTPEHYVQANDERHREMQATCEEEEDIGDEMTAELESTTSTITTSVPLRKPISQTRLDAPLPSSPPLDSPSTPPNLHGTLTQTSNVSTTTINNNIEETPTTTTTTAGPVPPQCTVHHSPNTCLYCRTNPPIINTTTPYPSIIHHAPLRRVQHPSHYHTTADGPVFFDSREHQQEQYPTCLPKNDFPAPPTILPSSRKSIFGRRGGLTTTSPRTCLAEFYKKEIRPKIVKAGERFCFCKFCFCRFFCWRGVGSGRGRGGGEDCSPSSRPRMRYEFEDQGEDQDEDGDETAAARAARGRMSSNRGRNRNRNMTPTTTTTPTTMRMGMRRMGSVRTMELD